MSCCGQCGGENHTQTENQTEAKNKEQMTPIAQDQDTESSKED